MVSRSENILNGVVPERATRYKGFAKVDLQNQLIAAACNIKRWFQKLLEASFRVKKKIWA
jgi:hypothetical protein